MSSNSQPATLKESTVLIDPGLLVGVLGIQESDVLTDGDLLGRLIETFVVAQLRAELALMTPRPRMYHLRTAEGRHEIDVLIEVRARRLVAIEVKVETV